MSKKSSIFTFNKKHIKYSPSRNNSPETRRQKRANEMATNTPFLNKNSFSQAFSKKFAGELLDNIRKCNSDINDLIRNASSEYRRGDAMIKSIDPILITKILLSKKENLHTYIDHIEVQHSTITAVLTEAEKVFSNSQTAMQIGHVKELRKLNIEAENHKAISETQLGKIKLGVAQLVSDINTIKLNIVTKAERAAKKAAKDAENAAKRAAKDAENAAKKNDSSKKHN
jgi:hypothetical protein